MTKIKFDFTISVGNILTMLGGVVVLVIAIVSIQTANAERDIKVSSLDLRVFRNEKIRKDVILVREDIIRIQVNQKNQAKMLERIINHLEERG